MLEYATGLTPYEGRNIATIKEYALFQKHETPLKYLQKNKKNIYKQLETKYEDFITLL